MTFKRFIQITLALLLLAILTLEWGVLMGWSTITIQ